MNIFEEIKGFLTAKEVAAHYGLEIKRNGMACCPFHDDHHPSMKIDTGYYCFACGAKGDAIGYVAQMFGLSQIEAAKKIVEDFCLPVNIGRYSGKENKDSPVANENRAYKNAIARKELENNRLISIKRRFKKWCNDTGDSLKDIITGIRCVKESFAGSTPETVFSSDIYVNALNDEPIIDYWLDIIYLGRDLDRMEFYKNGRKEVEHLVNRYKGTGVLDGSWRDTGQRDELLCG